MSWQDKEVSLPKDLLSGFSPTSWVGPCGPSRLPQPLCSYSLIWIPPSSGQHPRPHLRGPLSAGGHPCPVLAASPCSQLPGVGSGQVVRRIMREAGRCELVSASSSDLGPPSLLLTFPATQGSSSQRPTPPPLQVLLKLCCGSESPGEGSECRVLGSSPRGLIQHPNPSGLGCRGSSEHILRSI